MFSLLYICCQAFNTTYCDLAADWFNNTGGGYCGGTLNGIIDRLDYIEVPFLLMLFVACCLLLVAAPGVRFVSDLCQICDREWALIAFGSLLWLTPMALWDTMP